MIRTYLFYLLITTIGIVGFPAKNVLFKGKGFSYEVYCSKRDSFYLVELRAAIKYYWVGKLDINAQSDTLAQAKDTYLIKTPKGVKFIHKDFINCSLKPIEQDSLIYNTRKSIFGTYFYFHCKTDTELSKKSFHEIFKEYDKLGNLETIMNDY